MNNNTSTDNITGLQINKTYFLEKDELIQIVQDSEIILPKDHYRLRSGNCSDKFLSFTKMNQRPYFLNRLGKEMIAWAQSEIKGKKIDAILAPDTASSNLAFDIAAGFNENMRTKAVFAEVNKPSGEVLPRLITGHKINPEDNILLVIDVITTGASLRTIFKIAKLAKANVLGVCIFASRSERSKNELKEEFVREFGKNIPFHIMIELDWKHWESGVSKCDFCRRKIPQKNGVDLSDKK